MKKELVVTLKTDLFTDKHQLKIYKHDNYYALSEQKHIKKYYDNGIKIIDHETIMYVFELHFKNNYNIMLDKIKNSDYKDLIKNPSLTNLDQCTDKKIEITQIDNKWVYKKYLKYNNDDDWVLQFSGPCSVIN